MFAYNCALLSRDQWRSCQATTGIRKTMSFRWVASEYEDPGTRPDELQLMNRCWCWAMWTESCVRSKNEVKTWVLTRYCVGDVVWCYPFHLYNHGNGMNLKLRYLLLRWYKQFVLQVTQHGRVPTTLRLKFKMSIPFLGQGSVFLLSASQAAGYTSNGLVALMSKGWKETTEQGSAAQENNTHEEDVHITVTVLGDTWCAHRRSCQLSWSPRE